MAVLERRALSGRSEWAPRCARGAWARVLILSVAASPSWAGDASISPAVAEPFHALVEAHRTGASEEERRAIVERLETLGIVALRPVIDEAVAQGELARRCAVLETLASVGRTLDLPTALRAAAVPALERDLERTLRSILRRSPDAVSELLRLMEIAPAELRIALVKATEEVPGPAAVEGLVEALGVDPAIDVALLVQARRLLPDPMVWAAPADVRERVRRYLAAEDPQHFREAALTAASLGDDDAVPLLVERIDAESRTIARAAHDALRRLTGLSLPHAASRWRSWLASELAWWSENGTGSPHLAELRPAMALGRLREIARHRHPRNELAAEAREGLFHRDPQVRLAAVETLEQLGVPRVLPDLLEMFADIGPGVAPAARAAAARLLGREVTEDLAAAALPPAAWLD